MKQDKPTMDAFPSTDLATRIRITYDRMGYPQLRSVEVFFDGKQVVLSGTVESFYLSQIAQAVAGRVAGVRQVENQIEVESPLAEHPISCSRALAL